jgi:transposase-like protein
MPKIPKELRKILPPSKKFTRKNRRPMTDAQRFQFKREFLEEYKKDGMSMNKAAGKMDFSRQVIYKWAEADPEFAEEFERLRFLKKNNTQEAWDKKHEHDEEYKKKFLEIYGTGEYAVTSVLEKISKNTDDKSLKYWMKTDSDFKTDFKILQLQVKPIMANSLKNKKRLSSAKVRLRQEKFIEVFRKSQFNITNACKALSIRRGLIKDWCRADPDFKAELEELQDEKEDYVEDKLFKLIEAGNMPATIFASKIMLQQPNFGRRHAYVEQPQRIEGKIDHTHKFDQDQLDAMVRGSHIDRGKYAKILELDDPNITDAEIINESTE